MLDVRDLKPQDLRGLSDEQAQQLVEHIQRQAREIALRDAKIEKIGFELARLKAWKYAAKTEAMSAQQRQMFDDTLTEDEADLQAQLNALRAQAAPKDRNEPKRQPRRQALPEHLRRVEHRHEPADTACPTPECGKPMTRVGEDVSERLDIVPAQFFVHRHVYGKWACRCCERLVQEPADPQIIDRGVPATGLVAHTLISRFVDHLPYYRQATINARSGVHTPRSTLAAWSGRGGAALEPLYEAQRRFVLGERVVHVDETPVAMLDPGAGKTRRAYIWAYARGALSDEPGVVYDFCLGRGSKYPGQFLQWAGDDGHTVHWRGTLVCDQYKAYDSMVDPKIYPGRIAAGCLAHARRKYDELLKAKMSAMAEEALQRIAAIYRVELALVDLKPNERLAQRQAMARPLWGELHQWLQQERARVPDGSPTAKAIDYSLNHWTVLTRNLHDGAVPLDNNHLENQIRPWAMGRKAWLFAGSELAGKRAAIVMSMVQSAKLNGHDPWAYLKDVLQRLPSQLNSRIDELLPHRWRPAA